MKISEYIIIAFMWFFVGVSFTIGFYKSLYNGFIPKSYVVDSFKKVDMSVDVFRCGDLVVTNRKGDDKFYSAKEIDKGIDELNKRLRE